MVIDSSERGRRSVVLVLRKAYANKSPRSQHVRTRALAHSWSGCRSSNAPVPHLTTCPVTIELDGVSSESVPFSMHAFVRKSIVVSKDIWRKGELLGRKEARFIALNLRWE